MDSWPNWLHWISFPQKHTIRLFYLPISSEWGEEGGWEVEQEISWMIWFPTLLKRLRMMRRRVSWCSTKKNRKESESSSFPHTTRFRSRGSFCWTGLGDKKKQLLSLRCESDWKICIYDNLATFESYLSLVKFCDYLRWWGWGPVDGQWSLLARDLPQRCFHSVVLSF